MNNDAITQHGLLTKKELADRLKVHYRTIENWLFAGKIPCVRPSYRTTRFVWEDVLAALKDERTKRLR
ncbi:MAG: helix-turn-helix transcriptional regulator [Limisphaerales bacterium]